MELPNRKPVSVTDDGSTPAPEISTRTAGFPAAASSAVADYFDLSDCVTATDESAFAAAENDLLANGKPSDMAAT